MHSCQPIYPPKKCRVIHSTGCISLELTAKLGVTGRWGLLFIHEQSKPYLPGKSRPRCYAKSPTAQEVFLIPGLISRWFSMSPLPRLHHHDIMTIVKLFFILNYTYHSLQYDVDALKTAQCSKVISGAL